RGVGAMRALPRINFVIFVEYLAILLVAQQTLFPDKYKNKYRIPTNRSGNVATTAVGCCNVIAPHDATLHSTQFRKF
ncbi:MAG: hypothetical protein FWC26_04160, partial [Fibromonadales bacterium]|nr:hypothetical protein [Fibromonadales bacterium]